MAESSEKGRHSARAERLRVNIGEKEAEIEGAFKKMEAAVEQCSVEAVPAAVDLTEFILDTEMLMDDLAREYEGGFADPEWTKTARKGVANSGKLDRLIKNFTHSCQCSK